MSSAPWEDLSKPFPHYFSVCWECSLPRHKGVPFEEEPQNVHTKHNVDEIRAETGRALCDALVMKHTALQESADMEREAMYAKALLRQGEAESEEQFHRRLVAHVDQELGPVLGACWCGSRRYNLHLPDSDFDSLIVYKAHGDDVDIVLKNPPGIHPDYTVIELTRFVQMLYAADPRIVESLFLAASEMVWTSVGWEELSRYRCNFISKHLVRKYLSDATGKNGLAAIHKGKRPHKHRKMLYVALRTLQNGLQICKGLDLCITRTEGSEDYEQIMKVRRADDAASEQNSDDTMQQALQQADQMSLELTELLETCDLRENAPIGILDEWVDRMVCWSGERVQDKNSAEGSDAEMAV